MILDDFTTRAFLAGAALAMVAGPLGCFVVWRRWAYFGDATAHAAVLGVALSIGFSISIFVGVLIASLVMGIVILAMDGRLYAMDTLLGVAAHGCLALGLVVVSLLSGFRLDLMSYLFGDILAVTRLDLGVMWSGSIAIILLLIYRWKGMVLSTINEDLAFANGFDVKKEKVVLIISLAFLVAIAIKVVGALLITAMLIIPAASARASSKNPEAMAFIAVSIGILSVLGGIVFSYNWDVPTGPTIVVSALAIFCLTVTIAIFKKK